MTMDNDPEHFDPISPRKSYNPFESDDDEALDTLVNEPVGVNSSVDEIGFNLTEFEENAKPLSFLTEDSDSSLQEESVDTTKVYVSSFQKDVSECKFPEVSKDIDVDEGAPFSGKGDDDIGEEKGGIDRLDVIVERKALQKDSGEDRSGESVGREIEPENRACFPVDWEAMNEASRKIEPDLEGSVREPATEEQNMANPNEIENEEQNLSLVNPDDTNQQSLMTPISPQTTRKHDQPPFVDTVDASVPHFPSSITFSGPVALSGNASLRSESSTGSTRSFAFPVLQNEWNTSPVRMAKADRRPKKHKKWIQSFVCCRF